MGMLGLVFAHARNRGKAASGPMASKAAAVQRFKRPARPKPSAARLIAPKPRAAAVLKPKTPATFMRSGRRIGFPSSHGRDHPAADAETIAQNQHDHRKPAFAGIQHDHGSDQHDAGREKDSAGLPEVRARREGGGTAALVRRLAQRRLLHPRCQIHSGRGGTGVPGRGGTATSFRATLRFAAAS